MRRDVFYLAEGCSQPEKQRIYIEQLRVELISTVIRRVSMMEAHAWFVHDALLDQ
jgi:hypothetical protein